MFIYRIEGCGMVVEYLPIMGKALGLIPSSTNKQTNKYIKRTYSPAL